MWLSSNQNAEKEEFEEKQKALEAIALPVLQNLQGGGNANANGNGGVPGVKKSGANDGANADGPKIEEID